MAFYNPDGSITKTKLAPLGQQVSSSCGAFTTTSNSLVDVTNLSVTITTSGRPVILMMVPDGNASSNAARVGSSASSTSSTGGLLAAYEGATQIGLLNILFGGATGNLELRTPVTPIFFDAPVAGTYTYKIQAARIAVGDTMAVQYFKLVAFEL